MNVATDRVIHCLTGGGALDDAGKELEVLAATVDLRCPVKSIPYSLLLYIALIDPCKMKFVLLTQQFEKFYI